MNLLQHGAYTLLLDELYSTEQRIPSPEDAVRICQAATEEEKWAVHSVLEKFFKKTASGFTNKRFEKELKTRKSWCKWQKNHRNRKPDIAPDSHANVQPLSIPIPIPTKDLKPKSVRRAWPSDLTLTDEMRSYAVAGGVADPEGEFEAWRHDCAANHRLYLDWMAAWRTRVYNYPKFHGGRNGARQSVAAGGARTESFDERRRRESEAAIGEVSRRAHAVVSEVERELPLARRD